MILWNSTTREKLKGLTLPAPPYVRRIVVMLLTAGIILRLVNPGSAQAGESYLFRNNDTGNWSLEKIVAWVFIIIGIPYFWIYYIPSLFGVWK
jgi:hypothetical protein